MAFDLNGRRFSPVQNSDAGRVASDAVFKFTQTGDDFAADYSGQGFSEGHLIGVMSGESAADLIYHCRASDGALQAGQAKAVFAVKDGIVTISMHWQWLNGSRETGTSYYEEIT